MQMALVLVTGTILATAPLFKKILARVASIPKTKVQAIVVVNVVSTIACFLNWGFGLVIGAILAKEVVKKIKTVDYPLLIASAYSGFVVWHGGISGSVPLKLASGGNLAAQTGGAIIEALPALGIAGLGAKDIMGYCVIVLGYTGIVITVCLALF